MVRKPLFTSETLEAIIIPVDMFGQESPVDEWTYRAVAGKSVEAVD
ncbi:hypothetical protein HYX14_02535 [Candidatus Woesearchaeota archaeon]|nr:hypothetical protein [Candidatus Woesearchaeota archaeon]